MTHVSTRMFLVLALSSAMALAFGCSGDDRDGGGGGGTDSGTGGGDSGGGGGMCDGDYGPTTMDGCTDASDMAAVEATDLGPDGNESLADIAARKGRECAIAGMTGEALTNCVRDALVSETENAVSEGCATCYGVSVTCSAEHCISQCLGGDSPACDACRCGDNTASCDCVQQFTLCSGIPSDSCM